MPKFHEVKVSGGDRESLLRYAIVARLVEDRPEDRTRRGAPQIPDALKERGARRTQTWFTRTIFEEGSLLGDHGREVIAALGQQAYADDERLWQLSLSFNAAKHPELVAEGVGGRFWPVLRRLTRSRHQIDVLMSACAAVNYLRARRREEYLAPPDALAPREAIALRHVQKGLSHVAMAHYPESAQAADLLAVLAWWDPETPKQHMVSLPTGGRLARALDRTLRTFLRVESHPHEAQKPGCREELGRRYDATFDTIAGGLISAMKRPHTAASCSAPVLRLARLVAMYDEKGHYVERIAKGLRGLCVSGDGTADSVLRREAMWTLIEMSRAFDPGDARARTVRELVDDLLERPPKLVADIVENLITDGSGRQRTPARDEDRLRQPWHPDFITDPNVGGAHWRVTDVSLGAALEHHLPLGEKPPATFWRALTKQIALPTRDLLRELLVIPSTARARTIAQTLQAAGPQVVGTVTQALEALLRDDQVLAHPTVAKRAAWTIGFIGHATPTILTTLGQVVVREELARDLAADAAWAIGDVLTDSPDAHGRHEAVETLVSVVEGVAGELERGDVAAGQVVVAQAALHSLAIQLDPALAETLATFAERFRAVRSLNKRDPHVGRLFALADWSLRLLDNPVTPSRSW